MKTNLLLLFLVLPFIAFSQPEYKTVESKILRQKRDIKIQLPRNYNSNSEKAIKNNVFGSKTISTASVCPVRPEHTSS